MYDIVYNFISNELFNTTSELFGLDVILTHTTMVLFYVCLIMLVVWCFNVVKNCLWR